MGGSSSSSSSNINIISGGPKFGCFNPLHQQQQQHHDDNNNNNSSSVSSEYYCVVNAMMMMMSGNDKMYSQQQQQQCADGDGADMMIGAACWENYDRRVASAGLPTAGSRPFVAMLCVRAVAVLSDNTAGNSGSGSIHSPGSSSSMVATEESLRLVRWALVVRSRYLTDLTAAWCRSPHRKVVPSSILLLSLMDGCSSSSSTSSGIDFVTFSTNCSLASVIISNFMSHFMLLSPSLHASSQMLLRIIAASSSVWMCWENTSIRFALTEIMDLFFDLANTLASALDKHINLLGDCDGYGDMSSSDPAMPVLRIHVKRVADLLSNECDKVYKFLPISFQLSNVGSAASFSLKSNWQNQSDKQDQQTYLSQFSRFLGCDKVGGSESGRNKSRLLDSMMKEAQSTCLVAEDNYEMSIYNHQNQLE